MTCTHSDVTNTDNTFSASLILDPNPKIQLDNATCGQDKEDITSESTSSQCGILSCWRSTRFRCLRSKPNKVCRIDQSPSVPVQMLQSYTGSEFQSPSSGPLKTVGDSARTDIVNDSNPSASLNQSPVPTTLNEAFKHLARVFHRVAMTSRSQAPTETRFSCPSDLHVVNNKSSYCNDIYLELHHKTETYAELALKTSTSIKPSTEHAQLLALPDAKEHETANLGEAATVQESLITSVSMDNFSQTIGFSHVTSTCHHRMDITLPLDGDCLELSPIADQSSSTETTEIDQITCKHVARRSQSLVSSLSKSRRGQWIDNSVICQWMRPESTYNSSCSSDVAIAQDTNENPVTVSEEEIAELLQEALNDSIGYPERKNDTIDRTCRTGNTKGHEYQGPQSITDSSAVPQSTVGSSSGNNRVQPASTTDDLHSAKGSQTIELSAPEMSFTRSGHKSCVEQPTTCPKTSMNTPNKNKLLQPHYLSTSVAKSGRVQCEAKMAMSCAVHKVSTYGDSCISSYHGRPISDHTNFLPVHQNDSIPTNRVLEKIESVLRKPGVPATGRPRTQSMLSKRGHAVPSGVLKPLQRNRNSSYTEKFNERRLMALRQAEAMRAPRHPSPPKQQIPEDREDTCSLKTANILALAETSDLLGDASVRTSEKELQQLCFGSIRNKEEESDKISKSVMKDQQPQQQLSTAQTTWALAPSSPLGPTPYQLCWPSTNQVDPYWIPPNYTIPEHVVIKSQAQPMPFTPPIMFVPATPHWPVPVPSGWINVVGARQLPQTYGSFVPYRHASQSRLSSYV